MAGSVIREFLSYFCAFLFPHCSFEICPLEDHSICDMDQVHTQVHRPLFNLQAFLEKPSLGRMLKLALQMFHNFNARSFWLNSSKKE